MTHIGRDILELEDRLNNTASDQELSDQAIDVCKRLQDQFRSVRHGNIFLSKQKLEVEHEYFKKLLDEIWRRRSKHVLDEYIHHVQTHGGPLDG
jgi:hypothetical protein